MINILMPDLTGNERKYLTECVDEGWVSSQGRFVTKFEEMALRNINDRYCLSTSNGTVALHLALAAYGIGKGDEVIVPDITFGATLNAISYVGATPVIIDVDSKDWNMDRSQLDQVLNEKTKAVMPVALFGNPAGLAEVVCWAEQNNLYSVVDAAEAVGATINGRDIGNFGDAITYSYFGNKTITTGEGGAVIFKDADTAAKARILRDHGMTPGRRYHHEIVGFNYRMTNLQAAIGVAQYERLDKILAKRKIIFDLYTSKLKELPVSLQFLPQNCSTSNWLFSVSLPHDTLNVVTASLSANDIDYRRCFEPMSRQPAFRAARIGAALDTAGLLYDSLIMLPTHNRITEENVDKICDVIKDALQSV